MDAGTTVHGNVGGDLIAGSNNKKIEIHNNQTYINQEAPPPLVLTKIASAPPRKPLKFVGRKDELSQLEEWIASKTPVIVQGEYGIGKTSLIKLAANGEAAASLPDGVIYPLELDESGKILPFDDLIQILFDALYQSAPQLKVDQKNARRIFSKDKPLVLLNSYALSSDDLDKLLDVFPEAPILIAMEGTDVENENYETIQLGSMDQDDAVALLAERSKCDDRETLSQIASLLEDVPAAMIVVANAITKRDLQVNEALARLQSYTPASKDRVRAALDRAFALIFSILKEDERSMLLQAAAAPGINTAREWLEKVSGGRTVSEKLEELQLLQANSPRLRLMPGLRPFLVEGRDLSMERARLLDYLVEELKTRWNDFDFIKDELGNMLGLLYWATAQGQWANVAALGRGLDPFLTLRGYWGAWHKTLENVMQAASSLQDLALQGWVLHQLGTYEFGMDNLSAAQGYLQQAISIRKQIGDETGLSYSQHNLDVIKAMVPAVKPSRQSNPGSLRKWVTGGLIALAAAAVVAFLVYGAAQKSPPMPTAVSTVTAGEVKIVVPPPATETMTLTATQTASPSPTVTVTLTPASTDTPTATPTYAVLSGIVVNDTAYCFYGPGNMYLNKGTARIKTNKVDLLGRIETDKGIWVKSQFTLPRTDESDPCWMDAKYLDITPEQLQAVKPIDPNNPDEYKLPIDHNSVTYLEDPAVTGVSRNGSKVNVSWQYVDVGPGQYAEHDPNAYRYLIEAWLCKAGKIVFTPSGWKPYNSNPSTGDIVSAILTDESDCTEPSHARLYLVWSDAYVGPTEITPWPK